MLIFRNIIITLLLVTLLAVSVVGLLVEFPPVLQWEPTRFNQLGRSVIAVLRPGLLLFIIWWVVFLSTLLVFFITVARPRRRMKIEVQMGGGRVVIMDAAIKRYVRSALAELNDVTVKKIDLREQRGQVTTDIYADVRTRENLPTLERRIISRVRGALAEDLGITNLGDVHVFIKNFEVTGRPITPDPAPAEQPEIRPVDGQPELGVAGPSGAAAASAAALGTIESAPDTITTNDFTAGPAAADDTEEPVIGGESAHDAEEHIGEEPLILPTNEDAGRVSTPAPDDEPTIAAVNSQEEVIMAEKPLGGSEDLDADAPLTLPPANDGTEDREPMPWDITRQAEDRAQSEEDERREGWRNP